MQWAARPIDVSMRQHTSACVSIRQHAAAYVNIRQHTSEPANAVGGSSKCILLPLRAAAASARVCGSSASACSAPALPVRAAAASAAASCVFFPIFSSAAPVSDVLLPPTRAATSRASSSLDAPWRNASWSTASWRNASWRSASWRSASWLNGSVCGEAAYFARVCGDAACGSG